MAHARLDVRVQPGLRKQSLQQRDVGVVDPAEIEADRAERIGGSRGPAAGTRRDGRPRRHGGSWRLPDRISISLPKQ